MADIQSFLKQAVELHASDIHLSADSKAYARVLGHLRPLTDDLVQASDMETMLEAFLGPQDWDRVKTALELDTSHTLPSGDRFRVNAFLERKGWNLVARHFSNRVPGFAELGLPQVLTRFAEANQGLILVTGPGRSGKSTTAAAVIDHINATRDDHIITIEDPI
ncbi:MAG: ATPase, T2SS/T4P/T4SS family, partial [bacterium]